MINLKPGIWDTFAAKPRFFWISNSRCELEFSSSTRTIGIRVWSLDSGLRVWISNSLLSNSLDSNARRLLVRTSNYWRKRSELKGEVASSRFLSRNRLNFTERTFDASSLGEPPGCAEANRPMAKSWKFEIVLRVTLFGRSLQILNAVNHSSISSGPENVFKLSAVHQKRRTANILSSSALLCNIPRGPLCLPDKEHGNSSIFTNR